MVLRREAIMHSDVSAPVACPQVDVLVVDDDPSIRSFIRTALEDEGYHVATASNGTQAITHITSAQPSLVLLDLRLPGMSGVEVTGWLHRWHVEVPVVFMSAEPTVRADARKHQVAGSLPKPFGLHQLLELVERYTHSPQP
jgi:DNA-binding NtrC family response regulator